MRLQWGDLQLLEWLLAIVVASVVISAVRALLDDKPVWPDDDDFGGLPPMY